MRGGGVEDPCVQEREKGVPEYGPANQRGQKGTEKRRKTNQHAWMLAQSLQPDGAHGIVEALTIGGWERRCHHL
eukprot:scaffold108511_cov33-Tisochrysis_lutea.AAC.1